MFKNIKFNYNIVYDQHLLNTILFEKQNIKEEEDINKCVISFI